MIHVRYGVATIRRLLKIIGLFCKKALKKRQYSAKETYKPDIRGYVLIWGGYNSGPSSRLLKIIGLFCRISPPL